MSATKSAAGQSGKSGKSRRPGYIECSGKRVYQSKGDAEVAAKWTRRLREAPHTAFHCTICHGWHVGSSIQRRGRRSIGRN